MHAHDSFSVLFIGRNAMMEHARGLLIKTPWIDLIISGEKTWELRSRGTNVRGKIALIRSGSGSIVGTATLADCFPASDELLAKNLKKHRVSMRQVHDYGKDIFVWRLEDARALPKPMPYHHPQGAVIWVTLPAMP